MNGAQNLTKDKLLKFLERLGASARTPGTCYITGGGSALLVGWRETTIDLDLTFDPEPAGVFDAIPGLKRAMQINVELAGPSDFLPPLEHWRERSRKLTTPAELLAHAEAIRPAIRRYPAVDEESFMSGERRYASRVGLLPQPG